MTAKTAEMTQVHHLTIALLAVVFLCSSPISARVYQTDDAIIVEGKNLLLFHFLLAIDIQK